MTAPEAGDARYLLVFLDQRFGLPVDVLDWNLDLNLALGGAFLGRIFVSTIFNLSRAHNYLSSAAAVAESGQMFCSNALCRDLSVKTIEEQRQTAEGEAIPTKVTSC